jgi:hypothetical protein
MKIKFVAPILPKIPIPKCGERSASGFRAKIIRYTDKHASIAFAITRPLYEVCIKEHLNNGETI